MVLKVVMMVMVVTLVTMVIMLIMVVKVHAWVIHHTHQILNKLYLCFSIIFYILDLLINRTGETRQRACMLAGACHACMHVRSGLMTRMHVMHPIYPSM
jgi:hypothetical protein